VLIQTLNPEHFCIQAAAMHDYRGLFEAEITARQQYGYPPYRRFVKCTIQHAERYTAQVSATDLAAQMSELVQRLGYPRPMW